MWVEAVNLEERVGGRNESRKINRSQIIKGPISHTKETSLYPDHGVTGGFFIVGLSC